MIALGDRGLIYTMVIIKKTADVTQTRLIDSVLIA